MLTDIEDGIRLEDWSHVLRGRDVRLVVQRDDLIPFPLPGNKVRKLVAELAHLGCQFGDTLVSNGAVSSNHARTLAFMGARLGCEVRLVLHGAAAKDQAAVSISVLRALGAKIQITSVERMGQAIADTALQSQSRGGRVFVIPGGTHTPRGVQAFATAAARVFAIESQLDYVVLPSGTGATQAGIALAAAAAPTRPRVIGVSVARKRAAGAAAVHTAANWVGKISDNDVEFTDRYIDGGYGRCTEATRSVVASLWLRGLPLDETYTGKAFRGLSDMVISGEIAPGSNVLFWHTGGLMNFLDGSTCSRELVS